MKGISKTLKRRRHEYKTDYSARLRLLESHKPRLVVRKTNRYIIVQIVTSHGAKDSVAAAANSRELLSLGWPSSNEGSLKNLQAAYLAGLLAGQKAHEKGIKEAILDIGLYRNAPRGKLYAALRGAVDGGITIAHNAKILPDDKRLEHNEKTRDAFIKLKEKLNHGRKGNKK